MMPAVILEKNCNPIMTYKKGLNSSISFCIVTASLSKPMIF